MGKSVQTYHGCEIAEKFWMLPSRIKLVQFEQVHFVFEVK